METLREKPAFKNLFQKHRCITPANGFYEWDTKSTNGKQPYYITLLNKTNIGYAGIYDIWQNPTTKELKKNVA
ncbi:MAG: SOS response-associated peptidase family protein [candidate division SR1 bacterium]|nr:SOS response-associated peptidase family protein [candidate division SR1 bacterium]